MDQYYDSSNSKPICTEWYHIITETDVFGILYSSENSYIEFNFHGGHLRIDQKRWFNFYYDNKPVSSKSEQSVSEHKVVLSKDGNVFRCMCS